MAWRGLVCSTSLYPFAFPIPPQLPIPLTSRSLFDSIKLAADDSVVCDNVKFIMGQLSGFLVCCSCFILIV